MRVRSCDGTQGGEGLLARALRAPSCPLEVELPLHGRLEHRSHRQWASWARLCQRALVDHSLRLVVHDVALSAEVAPCRGVALGGECRDRVLHGSQHAAATAHARRGAHRRSGWMEAHGWGIDQATRPQDQMPPPPRTSSGHVEPAGGEHARGERQRDSRYTVLRAQPLLV